MIFRKSPPQYYWRAGAPRSRYATLGEGWGGLLLLAPPPFDALIKTQTLAYEIFILL
jgi:hypothetical protein